MSALLPAKKAAEIPGDRQAPAQCHKAQSGRDRADLNAGGAAAPRKIVRRWNVNTRKMGGLKNQWWCQKV